jgi:predicted DNA-binding antitoxin AbrB/MazE fold protein
VRPLQFETTSPEHDVTQIITATFENGVFKPDAKLDLAAGAKVQLVVTPIDEAKLIGEHSEESRRAGCATAPAEPRLTREQLHDRPTLYSRREKARERIQREWDATVQQRQKALAEWERLCNEHPLDTRGERMTRDQLHERR